MWGKKWKAKEGLKPQDQDILDFILEKNDMLTKRDSTCRILFAINITDDRTFSVSFQKSRERCPFDVVILGKTKWATEIPSRINFRTNLSTFILLMLHFVNQNDETESFLDLSEGSRIIHNFYM